jgi:LacI family transcriptional regulator
MAAGIFGLMMKGNTELAIVTGSSNVLCHSERIRGFREVLDKDYPAIQIAEIAENHDDEFESYALTKKILEKYPRIGALFYTAAGVNGGCKAVVESRKDIKVVTFDEVPTTIAMLKEGVISATIGQQPYMQGAKALDILFEYLTSGVIPEEEVCIIDLTMKIKETVI